MKFTKHEILNGYGTRLLFYITSIIALTLMKYIIKFGMDFDEYSFFFLIDDFSLLPILLMPAILIDAITTTRKWYSIGIGNECSIILFGICMPLAIVCNAWYPAYIAIIEELFFRGYILQQLCQRFNKMLIIAISSILFALSHIIANSLDIIFLFNSALFGFLLGYLYIRYNSLWLSVSIHILWNIIFVSILQSISELQFAFEYSVYCSILLIISIFVVTKLFTFTNAKK